ncbi:hypothetical protein F5884DRAFT_350626 [Xylogone sp. PMI_703]|nr:hypothetical protein F5884DRAFT_350626 [Xylogone sp. PMI_703]
MFLHQVQHLQHSARYSEQQERGRHILKIPFSFTIPKMLFPYDTVSEQFLHLPPSIKAGESTIDRAGHIYMQPLISYNLHASADFHSQVIGPVTIQNTCEIRLMPFTQVKPPLAAEDFPGEYSFSETKALTKLPFGGSFGDMTISMKEPAALRFKQGSSGGHTAGYLKLALKSSGALAKISKSRRLMCTIRSGILVKVFSSVAPLSGMPSSSMSETDKRLRLQASHLSLPTRKIEVYLEKSDNERTDGESKDAQCSTWTATLTLPIACTKTLLPTFCSRLAALRYAFKVHLDIKGVYHLPLSLEVPLQVLYCGHEGGHLDCDSTYSSELVDGTGIFGLQEVS